MAILNLLIINSGSSSLKASFFNTDGRRRNFHYSKLGGDNAASHHRAFEKLMQELKGDRPDVIGHRFVHGGDVNDASRLIDPQEYARLESLIHLAPLHLPANLLGVKLGELYFGVPQVACFDTAFHATLPEMSWRLPIPQTLGYRRYGFHGISYAHIARKLPELIGDLAYGRVVVAHLGSGASLCLMNQLKSVDTSMGYTPAGGVCMGTRSGDLDPGLMLELSKRLDSAALSQLVYQQMGLLALSDGLSSDMSELLASDLPAADFAWRYFSQCVRSTIGAYAANAGGLDALVFTGGIGEHSARIRAEICRPLGFLGIKINEQSNHRQQLQIGATTSIPVLIIAADEEQEIARLTLACLKLHE